MSTLENPPLVSVIIPTYKRSDMLPRAIDSILNQTYPNIEIIIIDDNIPNSEWRNTTEKLIEKYRNYTNVKYIRHPRNLNGAYARNTGIKYSNGEIVTFLDDDDYYLPSKIQRQAEYLIKHERFRAVYCGWQRNGEHHIPNGEGDLSFDILSGNNIILTDAIMMWRKDAIDCGGWDINLKRHQEAAFLLNYFRAGGEIGRVGESLIKYDMSDRGNVSNPFENEEQLKYIFNKYVDLINRCETQKKGSKNMIDSCRMNGIALSYLKSLHILNAIRVYASGFLQMPTTMCRVICRYIITRYKK